MTEHEDRWAPEDENVVRRLRDSKPRLSGLELDGIKTVVMGRTKSGKAKRGAPRSRLLVAFLTVGLMVAGTAGTIAASNSSFSSGTGAAQSQYRPPKCNPKHEECQCPSNSVRHSRDACTCPAGQSFGEGTNDCFCPNGSHPTDAGKCVDRDPGATTAEPTRSARPITTTTNITAKSRHLTTPPRLRTRSDSGAAVLVTHSRKRS
jgi:hypothetical protein